MKKEVEKKNANARVRIYAHTEGASAKMHVVDIQHKKNGKYWQC